MSISVTAGKVSSLGYIILLTQDIDAWREFGSDVLGLMLNSEISNAEQLFFRMDNHPSRLIVKHHDSNKLAAIGWECSDKESYEAVITAIETTGAEVKRGNESAAAERGVTEYAGSKDPDGNPFEVFHTRTGLRDNFQSPLDIDKFVTGKLGMGHAVIPAPKLTVTEAFYKNILGFGASDNLTLPSPTAGMPDMNIRFFHANNPRHHSLALFNWPNPLGLVHLLLEVSSVDEVGTCLDRIHAGDYPLMATLGRHCNDNMLSFYVIGPGGFAIEYGCDGLKIDSDNYQTTVSTRADVWGHDYMPPVPA
ncbi:VOC family protein [Microbulbifer sp. 2205BS26-8]|uniref:VOC family protein n=1 Tax=Microbulbifer sp. 2205BS26-8 TaxID=3064386 RepID=UPI00273F81C5|nr:VOC family protein [Microbulbifer sp. 2205BS26-8]MDP5209263.1 VOC family protein [Microbulbifer sp. 2205BS26-8]